MEEGKIYCAECGAIKTSKYCEKCGKETSNLFKIELKESIRSKVSMSRGVKRGDISWAYFPIAYGIILTLVVGITSLIEVLSWEGKLIIIVFIAIVFFYLCFFNSYFRKRIVWLFTKSKNHIEKV
ncbi:hypothetical protein M1506_02360 [Patescibacteria group bacterium]|nr:hypothetical protein [Patescibacteria group bacterium]